MGVKTAGNVIQVMQMKTLGRDRVKNSWLCGLGVVLGLGIAPPAFSQTEAPAPARFNSEIPTPRVDYWQNRAADIARQLAGDDSLAPVRLVFVGDSITDFWHLDANPWFPGKYCGLAIWNESFGGAVKVQTAINLGVSGDRIEHVLHRLLPVAQGGQGWLDRNDLQPDTIFVMLGINNSFDSENPAATSVYKGVLAVVERIRERKPGARIVIQSLLPTDDDTKNRDLVVPVNRQLRAFADNASGIEFLDLYPAFVDDAGAQRRNLFNDGLHPSRDGYDVWRDRLVGFLAAG
jgi:lysophospholipase L1-like esterase